MKKIFTILLLILYVTAINAQVSQMWAARYDGPQSPYNPAGSHDGASSIATDDSGYVYVTGFSFNDATDSIAYTTIKYSSTGVVQWVARYSGFANVPNAATAIAVDNAGNVYVTGSSPGINADFDFTTIKYNSAGAEQWVTKYNGPGNGEDYAVSLALDEAGNVYVAGNSSGIGSGYDFATVKYNSAGVEQWAARYNGTGNTSDYLNALAVDNTGNVYVCGTVNNGNFIDADYVTIKYNSAGSVQWVATYDGPGNSFDGARAISLDNAGNVYVTGLSSGLGGTSQYATIKYNSVGVEQWAARYNGPVSGTNRATSMVVDEASNVYVTGASYGGGANGEDGYDYATVKYNSSGAQQWAARYDGPGHGYDGATNITVDAEGNVYVTGESKGVISSYNFMYHDYATIKYDSLGVQLWEARYNGPANSYDSPTGIALDAAGNVLVTGISSSSGAYHYPGDYATIKYYQGYYLVVSSPSAGEVWVSGETKTIRWTGGQPGQLLSLDYSTNNGQTFLDIAFAVPSDSGYFVWDVPFNLLTAKAKIKITDIADTNVFAISDTFKIKGYILTRLNNSGDYDPYDIDRDTYIFGNDSIWLWPHEWWQRFDYSGIDPFTGLGYLAGGTITTQHFLKSKRSDFPDWVSWVRTFGTDACYYRMSFPPSYSPSAVLKWKLKAQEWGGSCFGMSTSSALLFKNRNQFLSVYPDFPNSNAGQVLPAGAREVVNELFTHQFGKEHLSYRFNVGFQKTPNETLNDIKKMLIDDEEPVRTLSIVSNDPQDAGGHSIMAYKLEQDFQFPNIYHIYVYDNSYPELLGTSTIIVDTQANNGNGIWSPTYAWQNWGGTKTFYLRDPAPDYLSKPSLPEKRFSSPFLIDNTRIEILYTRDASITIADDNGNTSGYVNGVLLNEIPNSFPDIIENGSSGAPIGYLLPNGTYSVKMNNYNDEPMAGFFNGNKAFLFSRNNYQSSQTDNLFYDGGISYTNPDSVPKQISLISVLSEISGGGGLAVSGSKSTSSESTVTSEKAYAVNNLLMAPNDSIKLDYTYDEKLILMNFGSAKNYSLAVELAGEFVSGSFSNENINLAANSTHTILPDWNAIYNNPLQILVDVGNDGIYDDTLEVDNLLNDPVPVELLTFTAVNSASGVKLNWQTATEVNNFGFEVERKSISANNSNAETWTKLGFVPGSGNSSSPKLYSFTDKTAKEGKHLYRLKQIDADGKFQFSNTIEVDVKNIPLVFALEQNYPNPFNPSTKISWQSPVGSYQTLKVYDLLGNEVATLVNEYRDAGRYEIIFDASQLASGVYFYKLEAHPAQAGTSSFVQTKKFLLIK